MTPKQCRAVLEWDQPHLAEVARLHVLRLSPAEVSIVLSSLVDAADELAEEFALLDGQALAEAKRVRDTLESVIGRLTALGLRT